MSATQSIDALLNTGDTSAPLVKLAAASRLGSPGSASDFLQPADLQRLEAAERACGEIKIKF